MRIWGAMQGREQHVLPEADGTLRTPVWLDGLAAQRAILRHQIPPILAPHRSRDSYARAARIGGRVLRQSGAAVARDRIWRRDVDTQQVLAARLRVLCESLGPTYVKLAQIVSGGPGLFPDLLVEEFASLRDRVTPFGFDEVQRILAEDLPGGIHAYADFDPQPLAAASIAQVHQATLRDGRDVIVKVQRPGLAAQVRGDLELMSMLAHEGLKRSDALALANPIAVIEYFAETILEELDFRLEAENQLDVREAVRRSAVADGVAVPRPHPLLVSRRVLTMERLHGFSYDDAEAARETGVDTAEMLRSGFLCFIEGAMRHGVFHGDLHGGNIMVCHDGRYGILDYGIVGRLSPDDRMAFVQMMAAATRGDVVGQFAAFRLMGAVPPDADLEALAEEVGELPFASELRMPRADELAEMMKSTLHVMMRANFRLPKLLVLLTKNLIFVDDAVARFAPDMDLMGEAGATFLQLAQDLAEHDPYADSLLSPV